MKLISWNKFLRQIAIKPDRSFFSFSSQLHKSLRCILKSIHFNAKVRKVKCSKEETLNCVHYPWWDWNTSLIYLIFIKLVAHTTIYPTLESKVSSISYLFRGTFQWTQLYHLDRAHWNTRENTKQSDTNILLVKLLWWKCITSPKH